MGIDRTDMAWRQTADKLAYCSYHPINHPPCGNEPAWSARHKVYYSFAPEERQPFGVCAEHEQRYRANAGFDLEPFAGPAQAEP